MKYIDNYNNHMNILYAFDLDNTLIKNIKFENKVKDLLIEKKSLKNLLYNELDKINIDIDDLKYENDRIYIEDIYHVINIPENSLWVRKKDRIYLKTPEDFFLYNEGTPIEINNKMVSLYKSVSKKSIITIRKNIFKDQTIKTLDNLNIEYPNEGLYMYPYSIIKNKSEWKLDILLKLYKNYNKIEYFDDNIKILKRIRKNIKDKNIYLYHVKDNEYRKI